MTLVSSRMSMWRVQKGFSCMDHHMMFHFIVLLTCRQKHKYAASDVLSTEGIIDDVERVHISVSLMCAFFHGALTTADNHQPPAALPH